MTDARAATDCNDTALVARAQAGDISVWDDLFRRHHRQVWVYLLRKTHVPDLADEIASQVFIEAIKSIGGFKWGSCILPWLKTIAFNTMSDHLRKKSTSELPAGHNFADDFVADGDWTDVVSARLEWHRLRTALEHLEESHREVLAYRFLGDFSVEETATAMGKSKGAIKVLQHRAIIALRRLLNPQVAKEAG